MKNKMLIIIIFAILISLTACGNNETKNASGESVVHDDVAIDDSSEEVNAEEEDDSSGVSEGKVVDQLDLRIGDTGTFDNLLGKYEITLDSAKLVDEIDGEKSELDLFIYLDIKIKNISQEILSVDDLMYGMEVSNLMDGSGFSDVSGYFDSLEKMTGELAPGEEMTGQLVTEVYKASEYYFRKQPASVSASANHVVWTIKADEAK